MKKFDKLYFFNGRSTLNLILKNLNLTSSNQILIPEFTCDVLFQKYKNDKFKYNFYKTNKNFFFNFNEIKNKINSETKVIVIINFFGIRQNTKKIYNFCKKRKICLIIDDCHSFYNLNRCKSFNCDFIFFSPSKILDNISNGGILFKASSRYKFKKIPILRQAYNYFYDLKYISKKYLPNIIFKFYRKRPKYENINEFNSTKLLRDIMLSKKTIRKIESTNLKLEKKKRKKNFLFWNKLSKKLKITPLHTYDQVDHGLPIYFSAVASNKKHAIKIFEFGWNHNINIVSWPTLHSKQKKNKKLVEYWNKLVFFPMDKNFYLNRKLLNE